MDETLLKSISSIIAGYFKNGIKAGKDVLSFAESTLGLTGAGEAAVLLTDADSYGNGLVELVFSPDQGLRIAIEPFIPRAGLSPEDISLITAGLLHELKTAIVVLDDTGVMADIGLNERLIGRFMQKLNLCKSLPFRGHDDFPDCLSAESVISIRVLVRNSRYQPSPDRDRVIISMINGLVRLPGGHDTGIIRDCLIQLTELFNENTADGDIYSLLSFKKHHYADILEKSAHFSEYISKYSMEFLMSKKVQPPAAGIDEVRNKIYLIDMISTAVFGKPAEGSPVDMTLHFEVNDSNDM